MIGAVAEKERSEKLSSQYDSRTFDPKGAPQAMFA
jgi:hypothetical protein